MRIEPIKQIEQLTYKKKATTWEEFDEIYKFNDPITEKNNQKNKEELNLELQQYRPDDNGCIGTKLNYLA